LLEASNPLNSVYAGSCLPDKQAGGPDTPDKKLPAWRQTEMVNFYIFVSGL
jgi:hypothetical protein